MVNLIVLVGIIADIPTIEETKQGNCVMFTLSVPRNIKNDDGVYESDLIPIRTWLDSSNEIHKGDLLGVKGRVQTNEDKELIVVAEKITYSISNTKDEGNEK